MASLLPKNAGAKAALAGLTSMGLFLGQSDAFMRFMSSLAEEAEASGLILSGFCDQHHFLTGILAAHPQFAEGASAQTRRALQTLLHPEMLGRKFQSYEFNFCSCSRSELTDFA